MNEQLVADIQATRKVLEELGWDQGFRVRVEGGPVCLLIAAYRAQRDDERAYVLLECLQRQVLLLDPSWPEGLKRASIALWNDAPARTFNDVLALLDKAEAEARSK